MNDSWGTTDCVRSLSLYDEGLKEAERHKWIESQKQGRDLGESALHEWYHRYWPHYCRCKRVEHLSGCQRWREFEEDDFGRFYSDMLGGDELFTMVLDRFYAGMENLEIINWSLDLGLPWDRLHGILTVLNINRARIDPFGDD